MNFFKKIRWSYMIAALVMIALGVFFISAASFIQNALCIIAGIALMVYGIIRVMRHFITKDSFVDSMLIGVLLAMFGFILMTRADQVIDVVLMFIGILLFLDGIFKLKDAFEAKGAEHKDWIGVLVCAIIVMAAGILIIADPFDGTVPVIILGISLILDGAQNIYGGVRNAIYGKNVPQEKPAKKAEKKSGKEEKEEPAEVESSDDED